MNRFPDPSCSAQMKHSQAMPAILGQRIAVIQHCADEGPGYIQRWAQQRQHTLEIYRSDLGQLPDWSGAGVEPLRACILLGGPWSVGECNQRHWMSQLSSALSKQLGHCAFFGICLGGQLLAQALGAVISALPQAETGWCQVTEAGADDQMWVLQWHNEAFHLPQYAEPWLSNTTWPVQGFRWRAAGRHAPVFALQFHPEWQVSQLASFIENDPHSPFNASDLVHQQRFQHLQQWFERQLDQWLREVFAP